MDYKVNKNLFWTLICILVGLAFFTLFDMIYGVWDHDGGYYLLRSKLMSQGYFPFADFQFVYFPLFIFLNSFFFKLPISELKLAFLIPFIWTLMNAFMTYKIAILKTKSVVFGVLISTLFFIFSIENGNNHLTLEQGIVFFTLMIFYFEEIKKAKAIPMMVGVVILNKQIGFISLIYSLYASYKMHKNIKSLLASYVSWGILSLVLLLAMSKFDIQSLKFHLFDEFNLNVSAVEPFSLKFILNEFHRSLFSFLFLICNCIIFFFLFIKQKEQRISLFLVFSSFLLYLFVRGVRDYPHYSLNIWPYSLILFIYWFNFTKDLKISKYNKLIFIGLAAAFCYQNVIEYVNHKSKWSYGSSVLEFFVPISDELNKLTKTGDKVLVLGQENIIEYLADRMPQDLKLPWYKPYNQIELSSNVVVIFNDSYEGSLAMHQKLKDNGFKLIYKKSFLIFQEPVGYIYVRDI